MKELVTIDQLKEYDKKKSEKIVLQSEKGEPNGVVPLDNNKLIPAKYIEKNSLVGVTETNPLDKDLNNYMANGRYTIGSWREYTNAPFNTTNGTFLVEDTGDYKTQIAIHRDGSMKTRLYRDGSWGKWQELATMDKVATTDMLNKNSRRVAMSSSGQLLQLWLKIDAYTGGTIQFVSRTLAVYQIRFYRGDAEGIRIRCVAMNDVKATSEKMVIKRRPAVANETSTVLYIEQPNYHVGYNYSVLGLEGTITSTAITAIPSGAVDVPIYYIADSL